MPEADHYGTLGVGRRCSAEQIRAAYLLLVRLHHPDRHDGSTEATERMQAINEAHETLSDPVRRLAYDRELTARERPMASAGRIQRNLTQDVNLRVEDFIRGAQLEIRVNDPANSQGAESYPLEVPPETAPGTRFRLPRSPDAGGGVIVVRVRALPSHRFKVRGSDLRCDLRISNQRAEQGGEERLPGVVGRMVCVPIPPRVTRGTVIRIKSEGLPKSRGGRGDLLVRITYRPEIRVVRK